MSEKLNQSYVPVEIDVKSPGNFGFISKEKARNNRIEAEKWVMDKAVKKEDSMFHKGINERYNMLDAPEEEKLLPEITTPDPVVEANENIDTLLDTDSVESDSAIKAGAENESGGLELISDLVDDKKYLENLAQKAQSLADFRLKVKNKAPIKGKIPVLTEDENRELGVATDNFNKLYYAYEGLHFDNSADMQALESIQDIAYPLSSGENGKLNIDTFGSNEGLSVESDNVVVESAVIESSDLDTAEEKERIRVEIESFSVYRELRDLAEKVNDLRYAGGEDYLRAFDKFNDLYNKFEETVDSTKGVLKDDEYRISKKALAQIKSKINAKTQKLSDSTKPTSKVVLSEVSRHESEKITDIELGVDDERELIEAKIKEVAAFGELRGLADEVFNLLANDGVGYQDALDVFNAKCRQLEGRIDKAAKNGMSANETDIVRKALNQIKSEAGVFTSEQSELFEVETDSEKEPLSEAIKDIHDEKGIEDNSGDKQKIIEATIQNNQVLKDLRGAARAIVDNQADGGLKYDEAISAYQELRESIYFKLKQLSKKSPKVRAEAPLIEEAIFKIDSEAIEDGAVEFVSSAKSGGFLKNAINRATERYNKVVLERKRGAGDRDSMRVWNDRLLIPDRLILKDGGVESSANYMNRIMKLGVSRVMALKALSKTILGPNRIK